MSSVRVQVAADDILRFVKVVDRIESGIHVAVSDALNEVGDTTVRETTKKIADDTGLEYSAVERFIQVKRATPKNHQYEIHIKHGLIETERVTRSLPRRQFPRGRDMPDEAMLVNVKTMGDDKVCPICQEIEQQGPYDPGEIQRLRSTHPHFLSPPLGCRCATIPFRVTRRKLETRQRFGRGATIESRDTLKQLSDKIRQNIRTVIRVK